MTEAYLTPSSVRVEEVVRTGGAISPRDTHADMACGAEVMPEGADPEKWAKAQAIKARMAAASAQVRERNAGLEQVASITVVLHKSGQVSMSSLCGGGPDTGPWRFEQDLLGQRVQELAQELRDRLLYGVRF